MTNCPCCSGLSYDECCAPLIQQQTPAKTPEQLMRSRYTAYNQANINYIANTMRGKAALGFNPVASKQWATEVKWLGLTVLRSFIVTSHNNLEKPSQPILREMVSNS